jgi:hypothetical protein
MANIMSLNTANYAGINQVLVNTQGGLYDHLGQKVGATVTLTAAAADQVKKAELLSLKPNGANPLLTEA